MGRRYGVPATLASRGARHGDDAEDVRDRVWYAVHAEFELALADFPTGLRAAQPRRVCRQRDGFPRGDGPEPLRQDRARDEPQHLGGALTERFATSAADALYAAYRMARLGIIVMDLCRPIPFRDDEAPSVTSLVANVLRRRSEARPD